MKMLLIKVICYCVGSRVKRSTRVGEEKKKLLISCGDENQLLLYLRYEWNIKKCKGIFIKIFVYQYAV